jgi:hypothetical protein
MNEERMWKKLIRVITLRPYGSNLSDGAVEIWLFFATLNVAAVAFCDAIAWGYLGFTTATGWAAYLAAALAGGIALILVGSLDATFIMHDTSHEGAATASQPNGQKGAMNWLRGNLRRNHLAVAVRIVLVIVSFTVTAPFLTQLFFASDISAAIERKNEQTVAIKRTELAAKYDRQLADLSARLATRMKDLEAEVAGSGRSGRYGDGPTATAIRADVTALQSEIGNVEGARTAELQLFDTATPAVRANRYGVDVQREGPDTRARIVEEMEKSPAFRSTRRTIKAFLVFLFLGLVSLKLFQPESVKVYFNAELQAAYSRLKAGLFDAQLDPREHAGAGMAPLHFARWYARRQHVRELTEELRDRAAQIGERAKVREDAYAVMKESLTTDIARMNEDFSTARRAKADLEQKLEAARIELTSLNTTIADQEQELRDFAQLRDDLPLRERQFLVDGRMKAVQTLATTRVRANELTATVASLTAQLDSSREYVHAITASLEDAGRDLVQLNKMIADARQQNLRDLS